MGLNVRRRWLAAFLLLALAGCSRPQTTATVITVPPPKVYHSISTPSPEKTLLAQTVTADKLYTIYSLNLNQGALPDQRFYRRLLHVTGVFEGINHGLPGRSFLELGTHDPDAFAYAELGADSTDLAATLQVGSPVKLLCIGEGMVGGSPLLGECRGE